MVMFPLSRPVFRPYPPERGVVFEPDLGSQTGYVPDMAGHAVGARVGAVTRFGPYLAYLDFDGVDDQVVFGNLEALNFGTDRDFAVEAILYVKQSVKDWCPLVSKIESSNFGGWVLRHTTCGIIDFRISDAGGTNLKAIDTVDTRNQWVHVVASVSRTNGILMSVNGRISASSSGTSAFDISNTWPLAFATSGQFSAHTPMLMAFCRVYNYAMSPEEAKGRYREMQPYMAGLPTTVNLLPAAYSTAETSGTWTAFSGATCAFDGSTYYSGAKSLKVTTPNVQSGEGTWMAVYMLPVHSTEPITLSAYMRGAGATVKLGMHQSKSDTTHIVWSYGQSITLTDSWQRYSFTLTPDANTGNIRPLFITATQQSATFWVDCIQANYGELLPWEPGF